MRCRWLSYAPHSPPHLILPSPCSSSRISVLLFCYELFWLVCMWNFWSNNKNNYPWVQIERGTERERERELAEQRWRRRRRRRMNMMHEITIMKWQQKARITKGLPACQADWTTARSAEEGEGEARHAHVRRAVDRCRGGHGGGEGTKIKCDFWSLWKLLISNAWVQLHNINEIGAALKRFELISLASLTHIAYSKVPHTDLFIHT